MGPVRATMLESTVFHPGTPALSAGYIRIRDQIVINEKLKKKLEAVAGSVTLVARNIEHAPGIDLIMHSHQIVIVADHYDAKGQTIDVSGFNDVSGTKEAAPGSDGATGATGFASHTMNIPGGPGTGGTNGNNAANAGSIKIVVQRLGDVRLVANGGNGGKGGDGGDGGRGGDGRSDTLYFDGFPGSTGGPGGAAGSGGAGGKGGQIDVEFTAAGVPPPLAMQADAGLGGASGRAGSGGISGGPLEGPPRGEVGKKGQPGAAGALGAIRVEPISAAAFWAHAMKQLGDSNTASWAAYRTLVGIYFFRQFKPKPSELENRLRLASTEFDSVLLLQPGNAEAIRYGQQIELGQNILGLPANFDLDPSFDEFLARFTSFATFISVFYNQGINLILAGESESVERAKNALDLGRISTEISYSRADLAAANTGEKAAKDAATDIGDRLVQINERIKAASEKAPDEHISLGTIIATVGAVAAAVGSVIAAVPTGGASLYALVPSLAGLAGQLNDIGGHLLAASQAEKDALKAKYEKVGKNVDNVVKGVKSGVNLVEAIEKLTNGKTPGNAEVVDLMRQGIQLSHELLVANLRAQQAHLTVTAREIQVAGSEALAVIAKSLSGRLEKGEKIFIEAGRAAIRATQRKIDATLRESFKAQRSVEIYSLTDQPGHIAFDTGFVHPDIDADFDEQDLLIAEFAGAYSGAFLPLLDPLDLKTDFDNYFTKDEQFEFVPSTIVFSTNDQASLDAFRTSRNGQRSMIFVINFADLPKKQFEAKIEQVSVALVGATALQPALNCQIQHGGIYLSLARDKRAITQTLSEHFTYVSPRFTRITQDNLPPPSNKPQGAARAKDDHFWGRGLGGQWLLTIEDRDLLAKGVDLNGLTEVQLYIEIKVFARKQ